MGLVERGRYLIMRTGETLRSGGMKSVREGYRRMRMRNQLMKQPVDEALSFVAEVDLKKPVTLTPPSVPLDEKHLVINWVVPDFGIGGGGHLNIFRMASFLETFGHTVRIYIFKPTENPTGEDAKKVINDNYVPFNGEVVAGTEDMKECDAIIATSWQTAYPVFSFAKTRRKFYFIQDYEPLFFPIGPEHVFAENTYKFGFAAITAGPWLTRLVREKYNVDADYYEFAYDPKLYQPLDKPRKKQILFYARSYTPRRGFELGVLALKQVVAKHPDYEVLFIGWPDNPRVSFPAKTLGTLDLEDLGPLYNESTLALVISLTNPSLLPPEMMACKLPVVDIKGDNTIGFFGADTLALADPDPTSIAEAINELIEQPDKRDALAERGWEYVQHLDWERSARTVEEIIIKDVKEAS